MNKLTIDTDPQETQRPRSPIWSLEQETTFRMAEGQSVRQQVVVFEDSLDRDPYEGRTFQQATSARTRILLICLLATSALAYLVMTGYVKF